MQILANILFTRKIKIYLIVLDPTYKYVHMYTSHTRIQHVTCVVTVSGSFISSKVRKILWRQPTCESVCLPHQNHLLCFSQSQEGFAFFSAYLHKTFSSATLNWSPLWKCIILKILFSCYDENSALTVD